MATDPVKRVVVVGGESTGKTTLVEALAGHYGTTHAAEFARHYLTPRNGEYTLEEAVTLAENQLAWEDAAAAEADRVLFCDTDALTTKLWSEYHFGDAHPRVAELAEGRAYDLYLHALPDIAWESDGLRFSPDSRAWFERRLKEELAQLDRPVVDLTGPLGKRLQAAIAAVDTLLGG